MSLKVIPVTAEKGIQFSLCSIFSVLIYAILIVGFLLSIIILVVVAEHQNAIFSNANGLGNTIGNSINSGQSLTGLAATCLRPFFVMWNTAWTFIFAVTHRIANANDANFFSQYSRFTIINVICDFLLPTFEVVVNFLIMLLSFLLNIVLMFLSMLVDLGEGNFTADFVILQVFFNAFLDVIDKDNCIHPKDGPFGFPGNILKCMGCGIPVPIMNTDTTTKTNALFVCVCGGDINGDTLTILEDCIQLGSIINFFESLLGYLETAADFIANLAENATKISVIWDYIQTVYNEIVGNYNRVRSAICRIPFVCKILNIRSLRNGDSDPYVCSYDTENPDAPPICFYESDFSHQPINMTSLINDQVNTIKDRISQVVIPSSLKNNRHNLLQARATRAAKMRYNPRSGSTIPSPFEDQEEVVEEEENAVRELMLGIAIFLRHLPRALATGTPTDINVFKHEFVKREFRPHQIRHGLRRMLLRSGIRPLNFEEAVPGTPVEKENVDRASPAPTQILLTITTYLVNYSFNGIKNFGSSISSLFSILVSVGSVLIPVVVQEALALVKDIFPFPIPTINTFNILGPVSDIFSPIFLNGYTQQIAVNVFETAFTNFSNAFDDVMTSQLGLVIVQYIFSFQFMQVLNVENSPPSHPDIKNINQLLTTMVNCNPAASCFTPDNCQLSKCNCQNGTVITGKDAFCAVAGVCACFPMFILNAAPAPNTVNLTISLRGEDYGYVSKNIIFPFNTPWQSIVNCLSTFWNGAMPFILTSLMWGIYVPWFTVPLRYTIGWCPCCRSLTTWLMYSSLIGSVGSIIFRYTARPIHDYCEFRSIFYCQGFQHFFRTQPVTIGQGLLFLVNTSTVSFGAVLSVLIFIVGALFIVIMSLSMFYIIAEFFEITLRATNYAMNIDDTSAEEEEDDGSLTLLIGDDPAKNNK